MTAQTLMLRDVLLVGPARPFLPEQKPRFSVIVSEEQAVYVNALSPSRRVTPNMKDGRLWFTGQVGPSFPVNRPLENHWSVYFPWGTRGDLLFAMRWSDTIHGQFHDPVFLGAKIVQYPSWDEFVSLKSGQAT